MGIQGADADNPTTKQESVQIRRLFGDPLLIPESWFEWLKRKLENDPIQEFLDGCPCPISVRDITTDYTATSGDDVIRLIEPPD